MQRTYHNLVAWQQSIKLAKEIYAITDRFPTEERFGLISQMRRATVSIASNIAEELQFTDNQKALRMSIDEMFGLLNGLINSLKRPNPKH